MGLADPLHALHRRLHVLRRRLSAYVPWPDVRVLSQTARADLDFRRADLSHADGRSLPRLPAAVGPDVVLGRPGDRQPVCRRAFHRRGPVDPDSRRLRDFRCHPEPILRLPRHRPAAGADRAGRGAPGGAARSRLQQPGRHRNQEAQRPGDAHSARRHPLSPVLHGEGYRRRHRLPDGVLGDSVLRAGNGRLLPRGGQLRSGRLAEDARAHRAAVVLHAVLRNPACGAALVWLAVPRCGGDGHVDRAAVLPALARPQQGQVDTLPRPDL